MPSEPRPKPIPYADPAPKAHVQAAEKAQEGKDAPVLPEGASVGKAPAEGVWFALVGDDGQPVEIDGAPVRVP
jgi:hypothetical protein